MPTTIVVPSRYPDIFQECHRSIDSFAPDQSKVLVRDGHDIIDPQGWTTIQAPSGPFVYSRNVNLGINQTSGDVLLMNDDCRFLQTGTVEALDYVMGCNPEIGILSPKIVGGVGNLLQSQVNTPLQYSIHRLAFVCVLIRRAMIDQIGLLDERFIGYGWDDDDYCRRATNAGFKLACTADASVKHGHGKEKWSSSFSRIQHSDNKALYDMKWGVTRQTQVTNVPYSNNGLVQDWWDRHPR